MTPASASSRSPGSSTRGPSCARSSSTSTTSSTPRSTSRRREPEYQHLFSQLLFSYKLNPQTVLFLGYSDNAVGDATTDLTRQDRTLFVKVGYAFVL